MGKMNLRVSISKKFKKNLDARTNYKNRSSLQGGYYYIKIWCPLCKVYYNTNTKCKGCPFKRFNRKDGYNGCLWWMYQFLSKDLFDISDWSISWKERNKKTARKELSLLRKRAKELITWV